MQRLFYRGIRRLACDSGPKILTKDQREDQPFFSRDD